MWKAVAAVALALAVAGCTPTVVVPSPSPSPSPTASPEPTASPTLSPSPSPTASPTPSPSPTRSPATRTPRPQPTGTTAGDRLVPYYFQISGLFSALPPAPVIKLDSAADTDLNARFIGLDAQGQPMFTVREDFVMDAGTAAHEVGHAYQKVLERAHPGVDFMAKYWAFRGFPGTWQSAKQRAEEQSSPLATWTMSPVESWAEAFRAAVTLEVKERTLDYGKTIDPPAMRAFFLSLASNGG